MKERTQLLENRAIEIVREFGIENLDAMDDMVERRAELRRMYHQLEDEMQCHYDTAKRHIAKACRRLRHPDHKTPQWGGQREGAGRPSRADEMRSLVEDFIAGGGEAVITGNYVIFGGVDADGEKIPLSELRYSSELGFYRETVTRVKLTD